ncbi:MAG: hypothetical protein J3Q66DRAFT_127959 [Benniella sp.]|nr:MAG: hypothetical protein J3Q66DRAFT_127959 [Benniella sp.]
MGSVNPMLDRKQRFRFHKDDEILLLEIVLSAQPSPFSISSRDGAIMVAWNNIAEEFQAKCSPRPDGKVPLPRTCRTRCDKMLIDHRASCKRPNPKKPRQESREDRRKNDLLEQLTQLQDRLQGGEPDIMDGSDAVSDEDTAVAGSSTMTSSHLLTQSTAPASTAPPMLNVADAQPSALQPHPSYRAQSSAASSGLVTQPTINMDTPQSDLLVNSGFLLPGTHQVTNTAIPDRPSKQTSTAMATRKRKGNSAIETTTTTSVSYSIQQANLTPNTTNPRRPRPIAMKPASTSPLLTLHGQQINTHHQSVSRAAVGIMSTLDSSLTGQGLAELPSTMGTVHEDGDSDENDDDEDEEDDDDNDDQGFQDAQEDLDNGYEDHDADDLVEHAGGHANVASLIALQNESIPITRGDARRGIKRTAPPFSSLPASSMKYSRTASNHSLQRHASNSSLSKTPLSPLFSGGLFSPPGGGFPSQMSADDRTYLMRTLALEEKRVKIEVDKIALEREKLALERRRLEFDMAQVNR